MNSTIIRLTADVNFNNPIVFLGHLESVYHNILTDTTQLKHLVGTLLAFVIKQAGSETKVNVMADFTTISLQVPPPSCIEAVIGLISMSLVSLKLGLMQNSLELVELIKLAAICDKADRIFNKTKLIIEV